MSKSLKTQGERSSSLTPKEKNQTHRLQEAILPLDMKLTNIKTVLKKDQ
jgi:hypothetical protein